MIQNVFKFIVHRRFSSIASNFDRRLSQGPWLSRELTPNKGPVLVIDFKDLIDTSFDASSIIMGPKPGRSTDTELLTNFRPLASFNWSGSPEKPIMVIPGAPRLYRKWWTGGEVKADVDERIVSRHLYLTPDYPMESMFIAMQKCAELENRPRPNFDKYDIATDRIVLRRLFEYCRRRGAYPGNRGGQIPDGGLRVDVERVGDRLIVFSRREPSIYDVPGAMSKRNYGQHFRSSITEVAPLFENSPSNRLLETLNTASPSSVNPHGAQCHIASYRFGDLKLLVRFNVACVDLEKSQRIGPPMRYEDHAVQSIPGSAISYVLAGQRWDYYTIELTSRSSRGKFPRYKWAQVYFSQVDATAIGWYKTDSSDPGVAQITPKLYSLEECKMWAGSNIESFDDEGYDQSTLKLLANLLYRIVDFVRCQPNGKKFAVIWPARLGPQLQIFEKHHSSSSMLPDYLLKE